MLKIFQFQEDTEPSLYVDFKRIITYVKFFPCMMHCVLLLNEKTLLVLFILPSSLLLNLLTIRYLSSSNRVKIYAG